VYGPIGALSSPDGSDPPLYRSITIHEYLAHFLKKGLDGRHTLDHFLLKQPDSYCYVDAVHAAVTSQMKFREVLRIEKEGSTK
jgi:hypothetical protein